MKVMWFGEKGQEQVPVDPDFHFAAECEVCGANIAFDEDCYRIQGAVYCTDCVEIGTYALDDENEGIPEPWV